MVGGFSTAKKQEIVIEAYFSSEFATFFNKLQDILRIAF